ncbi:hypothetical protein AaE_000456 [Aphanomyces astaci]|uniref:Uncharacterized protein n=1 Tax=Aphanomyces astaci TaxID=112090 RepID=A0A6A5AKR6_APHAT|nr:hypothetical protein AaE_000456 [Aphanomyces astaci]
MSDYQSADSYLYDQATSSDHTPSVSRSKRMTYVTDRNNGSYGSGVIEIDAQSQLMGAKGFASLRDSYITLPYVVSLQNVGDVGASAMNGIMNRYCTALKCGVWNVVDSLQVEMDGKTILTDGDYKLFWNNIRAQTEWSESDLSKHGADAFVAPDDWNSMSYSRDPTGSLSGDGFINNFSNEQAPGGVVPSETQLGKNEGFVKRAYLNPQPTGNVDGTGRNPYNWITQRSQVATQISNQNGKGAFVTTVNPAARTDVAGVWYHMLKIRLVDLHPIFKEFDLIANPSLKLRLRINQGFTEINLTGGAPSAARMALRTTTMTSGNTVPVMLASAAPGNAMAGLLPTTGGTVLRLAFGPLQNSITSYQTAGTYFPYSTSRLNIPFYDIANPSAIISKPVKHVKFLDCYAQYFQGAGGKGQIDDRQISAPINVQLSAFHKNIKHVIAVPFSETSSGHYTTATNIDQFRSPFDSAPWTCQAGSSLRSMQIQVGNENVFSKTLDYDYELYENEFKKLGAINGGLTHEVSNGLVDFQKFSTIHRYVVGDCSRITDPNVPQSVQLTGTNSSCQGCNLLILVIFERSLSYDRLTGEVQLDV